MYLRPLLVIFLIAYDIFAQESCQAPSGNSGTCISLRKCELLMEVLRQERTISESTLGLLRKSHCGFEGKTPKVCCESKVKLTTSMSAEETGFSQAPAFIPDPPDVKNHRNLRLLDLELCGPVVERKNVGGNKTGVLEFPWIALIAYRTVGPTPEFRCGGTVISKRYILTAAHCVTDLPERLTVIGARVGDHDIGKERDCDYEQVGIESVCAKRYQDFGLQSIHYHPQYSTTKLQNDVGLLRLDRDIDFRPANARPICLPLGPGTTITQKKVTVPGWGITENKTRSEVLLQVKLTPLSNEQCAESYKNILEIGFKQMCAGGKSEIGSCFGDSGGPLQGLTLYNEKEARYVQFGIVSFGHKNCGKEGFPGVYTRVAYFMDWILDTMED